MTDALTLSVYAEKAADYAALPASKTEMKTLSGFLARLPNAAHILDLGCGPGHQACLMQEAGFRVTAHDPCPEFVAFAQARGVDAHVTSAEDLGGSGRFDAVWAAFSLLHLPKTDMPSVLRAIHTALVSRGWFFLGLKTGQGEGRDHLGRYYSYYSSEELTGLLTEAGFGIVERVEGAATGLAGTNDPFLLLTAQRHD